MVFQVRLLSPLAISSPAGIVRQTINQQKAICMTKHDSNASGLSDLITSYIDFPEKTGNELAKKILEVLTRQSIRNKISKAAGSYRTQISIGLDHLVEEVRQETVINCLDQFLKPDYEVMLDEQSARFIQNAAQYAAYALVDCHLGSVTKDGKERTKRLSSEPYKWGMSPEEDERNAPVANISSDPSHEMLELVLEKAMTTDTSLHQCLSLLQKGYTQVEVAEIMGVSDRTVRNYLKSASDIS